MRKTSLSVVLCLSLLFSAPAWTVEVLPSPPPNDTFANATPISIPFDLTTDNYGATGEAGEPTDCISPYASVNTVWYKFTSTVAVELAIGIFGDEATSLATYRGGPTVNDLTLVRCERIGYDTQHFGLTATPGESYYLQVNMYYFRSGPVYQYEQTLRVTAETGGSISGRVTDDTGAPLPGICVSAYPGGYKRRVTSVGADGHYRFSGLSPGSYRVLFTDCLNWIYFHEYFGDTQDYTQSPLVGVTPGTTAANVDVTLTRGAHLTGVLRGADGPAANECVRVVRPDGAYVAEGKTDSTGRYSIGRLHSGTYKLGFGCGNSDRYQTVWFDGKQDLASADHVNLVLGQDFTLDYELSDLLPAVNDDIADALDGSALPYVHDTLTRGASMEPGEQMCGYGTESTVWYRYTPSATTRLTAKAAASSFVPALAVYAAAADTKSQAGMVQIKCAFRPFPFYNDSDPRLDFTAQPGLTYFIQVGSMSAYSGSGGGRMTFSLIEEDAPGNDLRSSAQVISSLPYSSGEVQMHKASAGYDDPVHPCGAATHTVWHKYTPQQDERVRIYGGGNWTLGGLALFESTLIDSGVGPADLLHLGCVSGSPSGLVLNDYEFSLKAGETYYFQLFHPWSELNYWPDLSFSLARM